MDFSPSTSFTAHEAAENLRKIIEQAFKYGQLQIALDATKTLYEVGYSLTPQAPSE